MRHSFFYRALAVLCLTNLTLSLYSACTPEREPNVAAVAEKVARDCFPLAAIVVECKAQRERECPDLKPGECSPDAPCPQCPAVNACRKRIEEACQ